MPVNAGTAYIEVVPRVDKFGKDLQNKVRKPLSNFGKAAGLGALAGLGAVLKVGVSEVFDFQKGLAQAKAVIKSTGGAAGVTSGHVEDLASAIQKQTGITDDSVVAGENLLLTFTNIRNEVGKGNDIFDQSTKILADMSQALGQDMKSSAIQLGKALNDPIKGVTALQRVGVSFTAQQKEQIKTLVESGHSLEAQKLILAELNKEFGGSAKAFGETLPGKIEKAKRAFEDFSQGLVTHLLPVITFATKHIGLIAPLFIALGAALIASKIIISLKQIRQSFTQLGTTMKGMPARFKTLGLAATAASIGLGILLERNSRLASQGAADAEKFLSAVNGSTSAIQARIDQLVARRKELDTFSLFGAHFFFSTKNEDEAKRIDGMLAELREQLRQTGATESETAIAANLLGKTTVKATDKAKAAVVKFAGLTGTKLKEWEHSLRTDLNFVAGALGDLGSKAKLSAKDVLKAFDDELKAMTQYRTNFDALIARHAPADLLKQLADMGESGAGIVAALAKANKTEFNKIISDWERAKDKAPGVARDINNAFQHGIKDVHKKLVWTVVATAAFKRMIDQQATGAQIKAELLMLAGGGPLAAGQPAIVGEKGPELVMFDQPAHVISNDKIRFLAAGTLTPAQQARNDALDELARILRHFTIPNFKLLFREFRSMLATVNHLIPALNKTHDRLTNLTMAVVEARKRGLVSQSVVDHVRALNRESVSLAARLQHLSDRMTEFNSNVTQGFDSLLDISGLFAQHIDAGDLIRDFRTRLEQAKEFSKLLTAAGKTGISQSILAQAAQAGPAAIPFLQALTTMSKSQIRLLNQEQATIDKLRRKTIAALDRQYFGPAFKRLSSEIHQFATTLSRFSRALRYIVHKLAPSLHFAEGGIVPGPIGSPRLAVVHGQEEVLTPEQRRELGRGYIDNSTTNIYNPKPEPASHSLPAALRRRQLLLMH